MELIGMLDSPYVRRVAIALQVLGVDFKHRPLSVFGEYEKFREINPFVKAPTLVCDNGVILTDSNLIIDYGIAVSSLDIELIPSELLSRQQALSQIGTALVACEKSIQIVYEHNLRPSEKIHEPWLKRISEQLMAALAILEKDMKIGNTGSFPKKLGLAELTIAVAWKFIQEMLPSVILASNFPSLVLFSEKAELLPEFKAAPHGEGVIQ